MSHAGELENFQQLLDNGTGRIIGIRLQGRDELLTLWTNMMRPLAALGPLAVLSGNRHQGRTISRFFPRGCRRSTTINCHAATITHHSQVDVFDHTVPDDIAQAATVMAVNALQLANLRLLLQRKP